MGKRVVRLMRAMALLCLLAVACEEHSASPPPPPEDELVESAVRIGRNATMLARIKADVDFVVPNLVFMLEKDTNDAAWMTLTLTSSEPGPDGSRVLLYSIERMKPLAELKGVEIDMSTGPKLDLHGAGLFTRAAAYQPKLATLQLTAIDADRISGKITGDFYKFRLAVPGSSPTVIPVDVQFVAARLEK